MSQYVELHCHSCFSLLDGAATPEALAARAKELGLPALALTDHDDLSGSVRFSQAAEEVGITPIIGAELTVEIDGRLTHLPLLAETVAGYGNLSTLITRARMDQPRGRPRVSLDLVAEHAQGLFALTGCPRGWVPRLAMQGDVDGACEAMSTLLDIFDRRVAVECWDHGLPEEREATTHLLEVSRVLDVPWVVTNDVHYARARDRIVHDVLCTLRHDRVLDTMGTRLRPSGEWYLKGAAQLRRRWQHAPEGLHNTLAIAERCTFRMGHLDPALPNFPLPPGISPDEYLERLVAQGAWERWKLRVEPGAPDSPQMKQLRHELAMIERLGLAGYFLIVWDIVRFARREGILCQGRGSAANSAVCYCLGITAVDPVKLGLLFERFLSDDRAEAPDIDIDFAHQERERVIQYVYEKYGRDHAAMVCEQITWRGRSAVRDAARVLGFSVEQGDRLASLSDRFSARATAELLREGGEGDRDANVADVMGKGMVRGTEATTRSREVKAEARKADLTSEEKKQVRVGSRPLTHSDRPKPTTAYEPYGSPNAQNLKKELPWLDPYAEQSLNERRDPTIVKRMDDGKRGIVAMAGLDPTDRRVRALAEVVDGLHQLPRHRSIHVGGFVLTAQPLSLIVPIEPASMEGRTVIQWEKDDLDPIGLVKIDLLGLGMLTLLQECLVHVRHVRGVSIDLGQLDMDDQSVYDDLCRADTIGVFQVESRAQMNTLPRLKPRQFYDLVVEVALIRPGPIQGEMVHPYLRRRAGEEKVTYPHPSLEPILKRTLGIPLFQEQGMQVAVAAAGFTPGESDQLRRAMGHKRSRERMADICRKMIDGMRANGIPEDVALRIYNQINAFADYGFPESHAASFALIVYASAYLRHYYAPEFTCALLNAQPMGFYAPGTIIEDARRHGVEVRPVDLTQSTWDHTLERRADAKDGAPALRLGVRIIKGLGPKTRDKYEAALDQGPFTSIEDFVRRADLDRRALRALAESGAFDAYLPQEPERNRRRAALWHALSAVRGDAGPLAPSRPPATHAPLPAMSPAEVTEADYRMTGLALGGHPMKHLRELLAPNGVRTAADLSANAKDGDRAATAGLVICRQRPGTAKGFVFLTLEDETGLINVVCTPKRFEQQALLISTSPLLLVRGVLQVEQTVVNLRAEKFRALTASVGEEAVKGRNFH